MKLSLVYSNADPHSILEAIHLGMCLPPSRARSSCVILVSPHPPFPIILTVWPAVYSTLNPPLIIELAMKLVIYCKTQHILDSIVSGSVCV